MILINKEERKLYELYNEDVFKEVLAKQSFLICYL